MFDEPTHNTNNQSIPNDLNSSVCAEKSETNIAQSSTNENQLKCDKSAESPAPIKLNIKLTNLPQSSINCLTNINQKESNTIHIHKNNDLNPIDQNILQGQVHDTNNLNLSPSIDSNQIQSQNHQSLANSHLVHHSNLNPTGNSFSCNYNPNLSNVSNKSILDHRPNSTDSGQETGNSSVSNSNLPSDTLSSNSTPTNNINLHGTTTHPTNLSNLNSNVGSKHHHSSRKHNQISDIIASTFDLDSSHMTIEDIVEGNNLSETNLINDNNNNDELNHLKQKLKHQLEQTIQESGGQDSKLKVGLFLLYRQRI